MKKWFCKSHWLKEGKIAYLEIIGDFDASDYTEFNRSWTDQYLAVGDAPVHTIIDASGLTNYPTSLSSLRDSTSILVKHPNMGLVILVGLDSNPLLKFLSSTVSQALGVKFKQVQSLQEARDILSHVDKLSGEQILN